MSGLVLVLSFFVLRLHQTQSHLTKGHVMLVVRWEETLVILIGQKPTSTVHLRQKQSARRHDQIDKTSPLNIHPNSAAIGGGQIIAIRPSNFYPLCLNSSVFVIINSLDSSYSKLDTRKRSAETIFGSLY